MVLPSPDFTLMGAIMTALDQRAARLWAMISYGILLVVIQVIVVRSGFTPNENSIWLYNGLASLLFGSRLLNPYFTPPADAATNAFAAMSSLIAGSLAVPKATYEEQLLDFGIILTGTIFVCALGVLVARPAYGAVLPRWLTTLDKTVRALGSPNIIFTIVVVECVWLFHRDWPFESFAILAALILIVIIRPVEALFSFWEWVRTSSGIGANSVGIVAAYQSPDIVLVRQSDTALVERGTTMLVAGTDGRWLLGIALNYVGRDDGNLLRLLTTRLPQQLAALAPTRPTSAIPGGTFLLEVPMEQRTQIGALEWIGRLCGIVDADTSSEMLRFEVIDERGFSEGRLVEARIGDHRSVLYQLLDGVTHEDIVQQKNKYGYARASAKKIGRWDEQASKFRHVDWLPHINSPVFLRDEADFFPSAETIGHLPKTAYGVSIDISKAITHNTAILGILGIGKTYLAAELIERAISAGIKVICLDLTNQYSTLLADFLNPVSDATREAALVAAAANGVSTVNQNREQGGSKRNFRAAVGAEIQAFSATQNPDKLLILNPAAYLVTKQTSGVYQGNAELSTLTPSEIAGIVSDAALAASQALGMIDHARMCLVYEEAHSLVPEWNSVAADGDKHATAVSARAILQGRKYGLGCLLITQRTANVTKTILNQCNTIFALRTFDDTGKDFLSNYLGGTYADILPSLKERHAIFFGRASSCENPVLIELNDREIFMEVFRAQQPDPQA
jgi:hypothetical protein